MDLNDVAVFAQMVIYEAGMILMDGFYKHKVVEQKSSPTDSVTQYDRLAESLIVKRILSRFPDHAIVGEEGSRNAGEGVYQWIIDPLDGTTNFMHGIPIFSISIALYEREKPLVGVVYDPTRDECFTAVTNQGAFLKDKSGNVRKLSVSHAQKLIHSLLATGFPYDCHTNPQNNIAEIETFVKKAQGVLRLGSAALAVCYVASGRLEGYWEHKLSSWDVAASRLIVEEAGGRTSHFNNSKVKLSEKINIVASNGFIHQQMLNAIL
jgi:myo-inositol-1(or 4)-monophosphatase